MSHKWKKKGFMIIGSVCNKNKRYSKHLSTVQTDRKLTTEWTKPDRQTHNGQWQRRRWRCVCAGGRVLIGRNCILLFSAKEQMWSRFQRNSTGECKWPFWPFSPIVLGSLPPVFFHGGAVEIIKKHCVPETASLKKAALLYLYSAAFFRFYGFLHNSQWHI